MNSKFLVFLFLVLVFTGCVNNSIKNTANAVEEKDFKNYDDFRVKTGEDPSTIARNQVIVKLYGIDGQPYDDENVLLPSPEIFFFENDKVSSEETVEDLTIKPAQLCLMKGDFQDSSIFKLEGTSLTYSGSKGKTFIARLSAVCAPANELQKKLDSYTNLKFPRQLGNNSNSVCGQQCLQGTDMCCAVIMREKNS